MCVSVEQWIRIEYKDEHWRISDGDGSKGSTNGTWLFIENPIRISDGVKFKAGQLSFRAKITALLSK